MTTDYRLKIESGQIVASDPCYEYPKGGVLAGKIIKNALNGFYEVLIERSDEGDWGIRNTKMMIIHSDHYHPDWLDYETKEYEGCCGVDAGCFCFADEQYYKETHTDTNSKEFDKWWDKFVMAHCDGKDVAKVWQDKNEDRIIISDSGYGDGAYYVNSYKDKNGFVIAVEVIYIITENDKDEDEEFYEEWGEEIENEENEE